jgi:DNA primase
MSGDLQEILASLTLEDVLDAEGVSYKKTVGNSGPQLNIKECPRCGNTNWKVYANEETGRGNCWTCAEGESTFNLFSFTRSLLGEVSNRDTANYLSDLSRGFGYRPKQAPVAIPQQAPSEVTLPPSFPIPNNGLNLGYLMMRGIDTYTAEYFGLRFCEQGYYRYESDGESKFMDFSQRVLFPVYDIDGTLKTFQGRDVTGVSDKKYLFPPGRPSSGRLIYNAHNAIGAESGVIGEGVFDAMGIKMALDREVDLRGVAPLATFGKHLGHGSPGDDQLSRLLALKARGLRAVTMMWDSEPKAHLAAVKAAERLTSYGLAVRVASLPQGKDPNEASPDEVVYAYRHAEPYSNSMLIVAGVNCSD